MRSSSSLDSLLADRLIRIEQSASASLLPKAIRAEEECCVFEEQAEPLETYMPNEER